MNTHGNHRHGKICVALVAGLVLSGSMMLDMGQNTFGAEEKGTAEKVVAEKGSPEKEATPPKDQHYTGKNMCAACHYREYRVWKHDKHALGFEILPKKYRSDSKCLVCHTTGYGEETGYKDASTPHLAGITCESCHGPGSKHAKLAQKLLLGAEAEITLEAEKQIRDSIALFLEKNTVESKAARKQARDSIHRIPPGNACVKCHTSKAHRAHLEYDKE